MRCFEKTDVYPFAPCFGTVKTDGVFVASSVLNAFRRKVYADYYREISECKNPSSSIRAYNENFPATENNKTAVICGNLNGLKADIGILKCDCPFGGNKNLVSVFQSVLGQDGKTAVYRFTVYSSAGFLAAAQNFEADQKAYGGRRIFL